MRVWKTTAGRGVVAGMALTGTYVPSKAKWVRKQVEQYEATGGEKANTLPGTRYPIVVVTSVGAKSGNLRKNPVMRVERDGAYLAVASKGGAPDNPEWYYNFVAHPEVEVQDGAEPHLYKARILDGDERAETVCARRQDVRGNHQQQPADREATPAHARDEKRRDEGRKRKTGEVGSGDVAGVAIGEPALGNHAADEQRHHVDRRIAHDPERDE